MNDPHVPGAPRPGTRIAAETCTQRKQTDKTEDGMNDYAYTAMAQIGYDDPVLISGFSIATGRLTRSQIDKCIKDVVADETGTDPSDVAVLAVVSVTVEGLTWSGGAL